MAQRILKYFHFPAALLAIAYLSGCATSTETKVRHSADGTIAITSPKNVEIEGLDAKLGDGTQIHIDRYRSKADPDAIKAQGKREKENITAAGEAVGKGAAAGAKKVLLP